MELGVAKISAAAGVLAFTREETPTPSSSLVRSTGIRADGRLGSESLPNPRQTARETRTGIHRMFADPKRRGNGVLRGFQASIWTVGAANGRSCGTARAAGPSDPRP